MTPDIVLQVVPGLLAIAVAWGFDKKQGVILEKENDEQWDKMHDIEAWLSRHEREAHNRRLELELKISSLRESGGKTESKLDMVFNQLILMDKKHDAMLVKIDDLAKKVNRN